MTDEIEKKFWEADANLAVDKPLEADDPLRVDTAKARGEFSLRPILRALGVNSTTYELSGTREGSRHILFAGHIGCGKSTELRRLISLIDQPDSYYVVFADSSVELDPNNLQYADVLFTLASKLCERLEQSKIELPEALLGTLRDWFAERILTEEAVTSAMAELKTGVEAKATIPFLGGLFSKLSIGLKSGASYKDQVRRVVRDSFSDFARGFTNLIAAARDEVRKKGLARDILFVVDGTDRLRGEDTTRFFIEDVNQLKQVRGNFVFTARIDLLHRNVDMRQLYDHVAVVPMIKLHEKDSEEPIEAAYDMMRDFVTRRVSPDLFDDRSTIDHVIQMSGGHPRDLVRLLRYMHEYAGDDFKFDRATADEAVRKLSNEFKYRLAAEDYDLIVEIDNADEQEHSEDAQSLLTGMAILQYNDFWWRSHPAVRTLPGYMKAEARAALNKVHGA